MPSTSKIRRRRKKKTTQQPIQNDAETRINLSDSNRVVSTTKIQNPINTKRPKPKLSSEFKIQEREIQDALVSRTKSKEHLNVLHNIPTSNSPTASQKFQRDLDFFTDCIRDTSDAQTDPKVKTLSEELITTAEQKTPTDPAGSQQQLLASSFIQIEDDPILQFWKPKKLEPLDTDILFSSNQNHTALEIQELDLVEARNLEDDGVFVQSPPTQISDEQENFVITRLLLAGHQDCIELHSGKQRLIGLRTVAQKKGTFKSVVTTKEFVPIFYEPRPMHVTNNVKAKTTETSVLKLFVDSVVFDYTNETDDERRLTQHITELYVKYRTMNQSNRVGRLEQQLMSIRQILAASENERDIGQFTCDRRDLRNQLHRERQSNRDIVRNILELWVQLKEVRQKQGFTGTTLKLVIRTTETNEEEDQTKWDLDFDVELNEVLEESIQFYNDAKRGVTSDKDKDMPKPDPDEIERMLHDIHVVSKRHPGEPIIRLELEKLTVADQKASVAQMVDAMVVVQLSVNKHKTSALRTANFADGKVQLNAEMSLNVPREDISEQCTICISENKSTKLLNNRRIQLLVPLPKPHEFYISADINPNLFALSSNMSGKVYLKLGWSAETCTAKCNILPTKKSRSYSAALETATLNTFQTWYDDCQIDPMDPEAFSLVEAIQTKPVTIDQPPAASHKLFRLNEDLTAFCSEETILQDKRLNMLTARFNSHLLMKDAKYIPPTEREIAEDPDDGMHVIEDLHWMDPIEVHRHNGRKHLLHIYRTIANHCDMLSKHSDSQDLLVGDAVPTFSSFLATIRQLFGSNRPLNPQRCRPTIVPSLRSVSFKSQDATNFKIIVNVIRAQGVPNRNVESNEATRRTSRASPLHVVRTSTVMPYIVAGFREKSCRTCTAEGSNPTWNEQLVIPVSGIPNLDTIKDTLHIQLFDEHVEDLLDEERSRANEIYKRISSRWLGDIRIPFFTVLSSQRVEGTFEINTPMLVMGYGKPTIETLEYAQTGGKMAEVRSSVHLTLFVHLEPVMSSVELNTSHLACTELPEIVNRVSIWLNEFREEFSHRCWDPLVTLSDGKRVCITRMVGAISIPFERNNAAEFLVRRFVGMIPILRNGAQCTKLNGVWLTNEQSLTMLSVSAKDLGTMLVGYYLALGFRAYLVIGFALPYGDTAFVLTKENGEFFLVDPSSGRKYLANDTMCPLVRVYAIVSGDNVWANIQRESRVFMMHFNVAQSSEWRPLFGRSCAAPTGIVHNLTYAYRPSDEVFDLKKIIEWKVMKKISAWRPHRKTTWNRHISETLYQILVDLEDDVCFEYEPAAISAYSDRLHEVAGIYKISGFPLNMRYTSMSDVVQRLKATGIHTNPDGRVEFSVAVHIHSYPCNVLSLWLFVVSLVPKN